MKRIARETGAAGLPIKPRRDGRHPARSAKESTAKTIPSADLGLGARIRDLRTKSGLTLASLSRTTGVAIGALSQLERGLVSPNVRTVFTISHALGVSAASLIDPENTPKNGEDTYIVRAGRRRRLLDSGGVRKDVASPAASPRLRSYYMVIEPGCGSGEMPYAHEGNELGIVLSGRLELEIEGEKHSLWTGDSFAFASHKPHRFFNVGAQPATVFWVNASP